MKNNEMKQIINAHQKKRSEAQTLILRGMREVLAHLSDCGNREDIKPLVADMGTFVQK